MKLSLWMILCVAFIDYIGVGLIFPVFSSLLFDPQSSLVVANTSPAARGLWLGVLIASMPCAQFFSSPLWGAYSDQHGRKRPLVISLFVAALSALVAVLGTGWHSLGILLLSRVILGAATGNVSIVQAAVADLSHTDNKAKNYSLYSMAMGAGFTLGPLFGGLLCTLGPTAPFYFAAFLNLANMAVVIAWFQETHFDRKAKKIDWKMGLIQIKKAFQFKGLRTIFVSSFLGIFGWVYFFEFVSVFLISRFQFNSADLGLFFGMSGAFYALSTGVLIQPLVRRFKPEQLFLCSSALTGLIIMSVSLISSSLWVWPLMLLICYTTAPFSPSSTTFVSNAVSSEVQGEVLGLLASVNAVAFALAPLCSGSVVGNHPTLPMWIGGGAMLAAGLIGSWVFYRKVRT